MPVPKCVLIAAMLLPATAVVAQGEELRAFSARPVDDRARMKTAGNTHFIYQFLPQSLPLHDDFSIDRTRKRNARPGDPDVTLSQTIYRLEVNGTSTPDMAFSSDTTFFYTFDIADPDSVIVVREPLPEVVVTLRSVSTYPPTTTLVTAWPPYNVLDTLQLPSPDTVYLADPFYTQDSLLVYTVAPDTRTYDMNGTPQPLVLWQDDDVFVNDSYALYPPTVGVATFDGIARNGQPYDFMNYSAYGIADKLTSVPINLALPAGDSIYLSFFYQNRGLSGDAFPQPQDSLVLEFFSPLTDQWRRVWRTPYPNTTAAQAFQQVMVPIKELEFLQNGFQMRFLNYATLSGSFDHWHLDYVRLGAQRAYDDTTLLDVAWVNNESTLLETYTSMPFAKYAQAPEAYMAASKSVLQRNLDDVDRLITWRMQAGLDGQPPVFDPASYGNSLNNNAHTVFPAPHPINSAPNNFIYNPALSENDAFWRVRFITNTTPDNNRYNDTITFVQELSNYYAYDDGTAEMGYGLNVGGGKLAYRFDLVGPDSLRALRMYFNPIANEPPLPHPTQGNFLITVWSSLSPEVILHQNFSFSSPEYREGKLNLFVEYPLDSVLPVEGTIYVGWTQTSPANMNLGFDRNRDNQNRIFYKVGGSFVNTAYQGSLMMRPVMVSESDPFLSVAERVDHGGLLVFPNPAGDAFRVRAASGLPPGARLQCFDASGRMVMAVPIAEGGEVPAKGLADGLHLLRLTDGSGAPLGTARLMIQH